MSNYLERVAAAAGRKGTGARPPVSGPPLLPVSVGLSATSQELWQSDEPFFSETINRQPLVAEPAASGESSVPGRMSARAEDADPQPGSSRTPPRPQVSSPVSLKNESQLTVHLPKTLRPVAVDQDAQPRSSESASDTSGSVSTLFEPQAEPGSGFPFPKPAKRAVSSASETTVKPTTPKVSASEPLKESQPRPVKERRAESLLLGAPGDFAVPAAGPNRPAVKFTAQAEPQPALAMQLPSLLVAEAKRKPEPRVSIGLLEVMVNNHPAAQPVQQRGSPPPRSAAANLERRYLDRFRLRP